MLQVTLCLLRSSGAEDALQSLVHHAHPVGGGCRQRVQKHSRHAMFLLALAKVGSSRSAHSIAMDRPASSRPFIGELASSPCGFSFDVILWGASRRGVGVAVNCGLIGRA
jgi:hypothetical protein